MSHPFPLSLKLGTLAGGLGSFPLDNETYLTLSASYGVKLIGIRSLIGVGNLVRPLVHSVLYHRYKSLEASPKAISGRTGYHGI